VNCWQRLDGYITDSYQLRFKRREGNLNMTPIAIALTQELLDHHRHVCQPGRAIDPCLITYGDLCDRAGHSQVLRSVGRFLLETAGWCAAHKHPPINALAVNAESRMPGDSYDVAPGCNLLSWPDEVRACIDHMDYPDHIGNGE
jgi:hypothetical protein